jgi:hypothetical protein
MKKSLTILAITLSLGTAHAIPIGERRVVIDQQRFSQLDAHQQEAVLATMVKLETIFATDRSNLTAEERRDLRTGYKEAKRAMKEHNAGGTVIYISTAGIIIVVLLLIILL